MQTKKNQSHNLTHQQLEDLQYDQMNDQQKMVKANRDSSVEIPEVEQHLVHVSIETPDFDKSTGAKKSVPTITNFYPKEFVKMTAEGAFLGKDVVIIHQPEGLDDVKAKPENRANTSESAHVAVNSELIKADLAAGKGITAVAQPLIVSNLGTDEDLTKLKQKDLLALYEKEFGVAHENQRETKGNLVKAIQDKRAVDKGDSNVDPIAVRNALIEEYTAVWGEAPDADLDNEELAEAIAEKKQIPDAE